MGQSKRCIASNSESTRLNYEIPSTSTHRDLAPKPKTKIDKMINEIENTGMTPKKIVTLFIEVAQRPEFCYDFELLKWLDIYVKLVGGNPNFTQIAILIFYAGYIYGRKVDYLWQTTNDYATKSATVELSENETTTVQQPVEKRRKIARPLTLHDRLYEAEMITKKFKSIPLAKTTEILSNLHSLEPPRNYFKKWKEYKDWRKQHKKKMKNPIPYSVVCDDNYIHPDMWKLSRIEDFDYDDDSESKRSFRTFTNYIEHRYSTLVPDINFIMHFKVKDFIEAEEDEIEIMNILGLPPPPMRTLPPFCKTSHSKEYVKELYNIEVGDNNDDYIQSYIALEDIVLHQETGTIDKNHSRMLEARNKLNDMRKENGNINNSNIASKTSSTKGAEKDGNLNQSKNVEAEISKEQPSVELSGDSLEKSTNQSINANAETSKSQPATIQSGELELVANQSTTVNTEISKEQSPATQTLEPSTNQSTNANPETSKDQPDAIQSVELSTSQPTVVETATSNEQPPAKQTADSLEQSTNPSTIADAETSNVQLDTIESGGLEATTNQSTNGDGETSKEQLDTKPSSDSVEQSTNQSVIADTETSKEQLDKKESGELEQGKNQFKIADVETFKKEIVTEQPADSFGAKISMDELGKIRSDEGNTNEVSQLDTDKGQLVTEHADDHDDVITVIEIVNDDEMLDKSRIDVRQSKSDNHQTQIGEVVFFSDTENEEQDKQLHPTGNIEKNLRPSVDEGIATCFGDLDDVDRDMLNPIVELVDILKPLNSEMTTNDISIEIDSQIFGIDPDNQKENIFEIDPPNTKKDNIFGIDPAYLNFEQNFALPLDVISKSYPLEKNILSLPEPMLRRKKIFTLTDEFNSMKQDRYKRNKSDGNPVECKIRVFKLNDRNFSNIAISPSSSPNREPDFLGFAEDSIEFDTFSSGDILSSTINHFAPEKDILPDGTTGISKTNRTISNDSGIALFGSSDQNDEILAMKIQAEIIGCLKETSADDGLKKIADADILKHKANSSIEMVDSAASMSCTQATDESLSCTQATDLSQNTGNSLSVSGTQTSEASLLNQSGSCTQATDLSQNTDNSLSVSGTQTNEASLLSQSTENLLSGSCTQATDLSQNTENSLSVSGTQTSDSSVLSQSTENLLSGSCTQATDESLQNTEVSETTANINTSITPDNSSINNTVQTETACSETIALPMEVSACSSNTNADIEMGTANYNIELPQNSMFGEVHELDRLTKKMLAKNSDISMADASNIAASNELIEQNMAERNQMRENVNNWHRNLKPILSMSGERHHFDIFALGTDIINTFPESETLPVQDICFDDFMEDKDPSYRSRYFLSMLQLLNTNNIQLRVEGQNQNDENKPVDIKNIHLKLLSRQRQTLAMEDNIGMIAPKRKRPVNTPNSSDEEMSPPKMTKPRHNLNVNLYSNTATSVKETPIFMKKHDEEAGKIRKKYQEANREILSEEVNAHRPDYLRAFSKKHDINLELYISPEELEKVTSNEQESNDFEKECPFFIQPIRSSAIEKSKTAPTDDLDSGVFSQTNNDSLIL